MHDENAPSDETLIARMRAGDAAAFYELFERHVHGLSSRAREILPGRLHRKVSVADILQEARITAHRRSGEFRSPHGGALRTWLMRIVELKAREAVRRHAGTAKRAAGREVSRGARPDTAAFVAREPSPSQVAVAAEMGSAAHRAMDALPEDYRRAMVLTRVEGLSFAEAAERMGRSREAVRKLYVRALARFTELFDAENGGRSG